MKKTLVAISYIRFSTDEQAKGDSFRRQLEGSKAWCERNGWTLDTSHKLNDLGVSGFRGMNAKTGKLKAFLDGLESGKIVCDGLIIESLDRLGRDEVGDMLTLFLNILSHGVKIITLTPEMIFDKKSINDPVNLILAIVEICRGFSESAIKSERVGKKWKLKKERAREGHKVSAACPGWMELVGERSKDLKATNQHFELVPAKVAAVRRLIELAKNGIGLASIAKTLNRENRPTLKDHAKHWHSSAVYKTLTNRALFGEYQPRFSNKHLSAKHRLPDGEPIADYYPALIDEAEFLQIQDGLRLRREINQPKTGRQSVKIANLFSKLMKDAVTGATIYRMDKGKKSVPALVSDRVRAGLAGAAEKQTFPADDYEYHFLAWLAEVDVSALSNETQISEAKKRLLLVRDEISKTAAKLKKLKTRLAEEDDIDSIIDVIKTLDAKLKTLRQEEEALAVEAGKNNPAGEAGSLVKALEKATGQELIELRGKLRFLIAELIENIFVRIEKDAKGRRWCFSQVHFRNGFQRKLSFVSEMVYSGGGNTHPMPERKSRSVSTPQLNDEHFDLRKAEDFVGWYAGLLVGGKLAGKASPKVMYQKSPGQPGDFCFIPLSRSLLQLF